MSSNTSSMLPTSWWSVLQSTSHESMPSQNLHDGTAPSTDDQLNSNGISPSASSLLFPGAQADLIDALSKNIDTFDPFAEPFGLVNQWGETMLYESEIHIDHVMDDGKITEGDQTTGDFAKGQTNMIFYPELGKIRMIVKKDGSFWPCVKEELVEKHNFKYDGCRVSFDYNLGEYQISEDGEFYGYVFGEWNGISFRIGTVESSIEFKQTIQQVEMRISKHRLPPKPNVNDILFETFWFRSGLRRSVVKVLCIYEGFIWKIKGTDPPTSGSGIVALTQYKNTSTLEMVTCLDDSDTNFTVPASFALLDSDIEADKSPYTWEWFVSIDEKEACDFQTAKQANDFKTAIDYYVEAWRLNQLTWDW